MNTAEEEVDADGSEGASEGEASPLFVRHISVVRNALAALDLVTVCNNVCCKGTRFHCPLCHEKRFSPTTQEVVMRHLQSVHYGSKVDVFGIWQCMQCCLRHEVGEHFPHYHSPYCDEKFRSIKKLMAHIMDCDSARADPEMHPHLLKVAKRSKIQPSKYLVTPEERLKSIEKMKETVGHFYHQSLVFTLSDLEMKQCELETCCMGRYHCPLCPGYMFRPCTPIKMDAHLENVHWKLRVTYGEVKLLKCTMMCIPSDEGETLGSTSHWHCPICSRMVTNRKRMVVHLQSHEKGTAWVPGINMTEFSEVASVADEPLPSPKEKAPSEVFDVVAVMVNQELMNMIPGSRDLFFQYLQLATGVQYTINNKSCLLQGKWDVVRSVQALLDQIRMMRPDNMEQIEGLMEKKLGVKFVGSPEDDEELPDDARSEASRGAIDNIPAEQPMGQENWSVETPEMTAAPSSAHSATSDEHEQSFFSQDLEILADSVHTVCNPNEVPSLPIEPAPVPVPGIMTVEPTSPMEDTGLPPLEISPSISAPAPLADSVLETRTETPVVSCIEVCPVDTVEVPENPVSSEGPTATADYTQQEDLNKTETIPLDETVLETLPEENPKENTDLNASHIEVAPVASNQLERYEMDRDLVDAVSAITQLAKGTNHLSEGANQSNGRKTLDQQNNANSPPSPNVSSAGQPKGKGNKPKAVSSGKSTRKTLPKSVNKGLKAAKEPVPSTSGWRSPRIRARGKLVMDTNTKTDDDTTAKSKETEKQSTVAERPSNESPQRGRKRKSSCPESLTSKEAAMSPSKNSSIPSSSVGIMHRIRTPSRRLRESQELSIYVQSIKKKRPKLRAKTPESQTLLAKSSSESVSESVKQRSSKRANLQHTTESSPVKQEPGSKIQTAIKPAGEKQPLVLLENINPPKLTEKLQKKRCGSLKPVVVLNRVDVLLYNSYSQTPSPTFSSHSSPELVSKISEPRSSPELVSKISELCSSPELVSNISEPHSSPDLVSKRSEPHSSPDRVSKISEPPSSPELVSDTSELRRSRRAHKPSTRMLEAGINLMMDVDDTDDIDNDDDNDEDYAPNDDHKDSLDVSDTVINVEPFIRSVEEPKEENTDSQEPFSASVDTGYFQITENNHNLNEDMFIPGNRSGRPKRQAASTYSMPVPDDNVEDPVELKTINAFDTTDAVKDRVDSDSSNLHTCSDTISKEHDYDVIISHIEGSLPKKNSMVIGQISVKEEKSPDPTPESWGSSVWDAFEKAAASGVVPVSDGPQGSSRRKGNQLPYSPAAGPSSRGQKSSRKSSIASESKTAEDLPAAIKRSASEAEEDYAPPVDSTPRINLECNQNDGSYVLTVSYPEDSQRLAAERRNAALKAKISSSTKCSLVNYCRKCPICSRPFTIISRFFHHIVAGPCNKKALDDLANMPEDLVTGLMEADAVKEENCPHCNRNFKSLANTRTHVIGRVCRKPSQCDVDVSQFIKDPDTGVVKCNFCDFRASKAMYVVSHVRRKHWEKKFECPECGNRFSTLSYLRSHIKWNHGSPTEKTVCQVCHKEVKMRHLKKHMENHTSENQPSSRPARKKYQSLEVPMMCEYCDYTTKHRNMYQRHMKRVHSEKHIRCVYCDQKFALQGDLNMHIRKMHTPDGVESAKEQCPYCSKEMLRKNLTTHIRQVHEKERRYMCPICQGRYSTKFTLNVHMEQHKPENERKSKFLCPVCGKGFINKTSFTDHVNLHTGDKPHQCNICGKRYRQASVLRRHRETHKGIKYACSVCGNLYGTKKYLLMHAHKHNPVKRHTCICGKEFLTSQGVDTHQYNCRIWKAQQQVLEAQREHAQKADDDPTDEAQQKVLKAKQEHITKSNDNPGGDSEIKIAVSSVSSPQQDMDRAQAALLELQAAGDKNVGISVEEDDFDGDLSNGQLTLIQDEEGNLLMLQQEDDESEKVDMSDNNQDGLDALHLLGLAKPNTSKEPHLGQLPPIESQLRQLPVKEDIPTVTQTTKEEKILEQEDLQASDKQYLCGYCQDLFPGLDDVQTHILAEHLADLPTTENGEVQLSLQLADEDEMEVI